MSLEVSPHLGEAEVPRAWESMLCFSRGRLVLADWEGLPRAWPPTSPVRTSIATLSLLSLMGSSTSAQAQHHSKAGAGDGGAFQRPLHGRHEWHTSCFTMHDLTLCPKGFACELERRAIISTKKKQCEALQHCCAFAPDGELDEGAHLLLSL